MITSPVLYYVMAPLLALVMLFVYDRQPNDCDVVTGVDAMGKPYSFLDCPTPSYRRTPNEEEKPKEAKRAYALFTR